MSAYRTHEGGPREAIVIPTQRPRWWALVFVVPLPLAFSSDFLNSIHPVPPEPIPNPDDWCGTSQLAKRWVYESALRKQHELQSTIFFFALFGLVIAGASLLIRAKTLVVIDRGARVLRVMTTRDEWSATFGEKPTLVARDGAYWLHAGNLEPVAIARTHAPRAPIERLRAALAALASCVVLMCAGCGGETTNIDGGGDAKAEAEAGDYGLCGKPAHDCLCACNDGGDCTSCYQTYPTCVTCIDDAVTTCCPNEYPAYTKCLADSQKAAPDGGPPPCAPNDTACQNAFCQSQAAALQTCLATQACKTANAKCTGTCP